MKLTAIPSNARIYSMEWSQAYRRRKHVLCLCVCPCIDRAAAVLEIKTVKKIENTRSSSGAPSAAVQLYWKNRNRIAAQIDRI